MKVHQAAILFPLLLLSVTFYGQNTSGQDTTLRIFEKVEKEAAFPGGEQAWRKFLEKNLNPVVPLDHGAPTGIYTAMIQFVVNKDGVVSEIKPLTNMGYGIEQEVARILRKSGMWEPATQKGKPVNAYRRQPVTFMVTAEDFDISPYSIFADQDNEITIDVPKVKAENLKVTISRGTITRNANGKYIARVTGTERVIIKIYSTKGKEKEIGSASLEVNKPSGTGVK